MPPYGPDNRLAECLKRVSQAENLLADVREVLAEVCSEQGLRSEEEPEPVQVADAKFDSKAPDDLKANDRAEVQANRGAVTQSLEALSREQHKDMAEDKSAAWKVKQTGVPTSAVLRYLRMELEETAACFALPQALGIFIFFILAVMWHFQSDHLHAIDQAITWDIMENANFAYVGVVPLENGRMGHKNLLDVNSIADFWSWFNLGLVPLFWPQGWDVSEARSNIAGWCTSPRDALEGFGWSPAAANASAAGRSPCPEGEDPIIFGPTTQLFFNKTEPQNVSGMDGTYLLYNNIVGGVRLRQERNAIVDCKVGDEELRAKVHAGSCVPATSYWLMPELHQGLVMDETLLDQPGGRTVYLPSKMPQDRVRQALRELENQMWFSPQTAKVEVLFTTYNPHEDLLTATYTALFLNRGGHIHKFVEPVSVYLNPYHGWWCYVADIGWALLTLKLFVEESIELGKHWRQLGFTKGSQVYLSLANAVDWVSIVVAFAITGCWFQYLSKLWDLKDQLKMADGSLLGSWPEEGQRATFYEMVDEAVSSVHQLRNMLAVYPFVVVSRFFKAFSSQPRLALVTRTLSKASVDIFHFGVVFFSVFTVFSVSAMILFGQELEYFANFMRSFHSVFRTLLGDFDWETLHSVGRPQAYIWFWLFIWLVNLVMLNMLLAIIMDVYTDVKGSIGSKAKTLWEQSYQIYVRKREERSGKCLSLSKILQTLDPTDLEEDTEEDLTPMFTETLRAAVEGLREEQAFKVLEAAQELLDSEARDSDSLTEATVKIQRIDTKIGQLHEYMDKLVQAELLERKENRGRALQGMEQPAAVTI